MAPRAIDVPISPLGTAKPGPDSATFWPRLTARRPCGTVRPDKQPGETAGWLMG
jgi:hypothetical protein